MKVFLNKNMKNKKAQNLLTGTVMFLILNIAFFGIMFAFVSQTGIGAGAKEQVYAKKICLAIDQIKPGTEIILDMSEPYNLAMKNNIGDNIVIVDYAKSKVTVRLSSGDGYSYYYFTKLNPGSILFDTESKTLAIKS